MKMRRLLLVGILIALAGVSLRADTITLTDGRVIHGHLNRVGKYYVITPRHGAAFQVPVNTLASIEIGAAATPATAAKNAWRVVQYDIHRQTNLDAIIHAISAYQEKYPHSPVLAESQRALRRYKQYKLLAFVFFAGQWMAATQATSFAAHADVLARAALADYRAGKFDAARSAAQLALKSNPANSSAMIIMGVLNYRKENNPGAAKYFAAVLARHPTNVIAINDLAITLYHQRQQPRALVYFGKALNINSSNRLLLDNIFIALHHYSGDHVAYLYQNLRQVFSQADSKMQALMAKQGLYRFGATWVSLPLHKKLTMELSAYQKQKDALQAQYDSARLYLQGVRQQLQQTIAQINSLNAEIGYLEVAQNYNYLQTGLVDLNNQSLLSSYMALLIAAQTQRTNLLNREIATRTALKQMRVQAQLLRKLAPAKAFLMHQRMMLPGDLTQVPPPAPLMVAGPELHLK
ncbi:MAG: tetratricopeptide repeat protein [Phycisphaerae bacterium]